MEIYISRFLIYIVYTEHMEWIPIGNQATKVLEGLIRKKKRFFYYI
jgi:hypothetical protein